MPVEPPNVETRDDDLQNPVRPGHAKDAGRVVGRVGPDGRKVGHSLSKELVDLTPKCNRRFTNNDTKPLNCDTIEPGLAEAIVQAHARMQRWMLAPPRDPPRWRTSAPPEGMDDGSWTG